MFTRRHDEKIAAAARRKATEAKLHGKDKTVGRGAGTWVLVSQWICYTWNHVCVGQFPMGRWSFSLCFFGSDELLRCYEFSCMMFVVCYWMMALLWLPCVRCCSLWFIIAVSINKCIVL